MLFSESCACRSRTISVSPAIGLTTSTIRFFFGTIPRFRLRFIDPRDASLVGLSAQEIAELEVQQDIPPGSTLEMDDERSATMMTLMSVSRLSLCLCPCSFAVCLGIAH